jgi:hypothetical protein
MQIVGPILGVVWVFGWVAFVFGLSLQRQKSRNRRFEMLHQERMAAIEKGIPVPELPDFEAMEEQTRLRRRSGSMLLPGILMLALGTGTMTALKLSPDPDLQQVWILPLPLVFLGAGFLLYYALTKRSSD